MNSKLTGLVRWGSALVLAVGLAACGNFSRGAPAPAAPAAPAASADTGASSGSTAGAPSFENDVHPLLVKLCISCHAAGNPTKNQLTNDPATDYPIILNLVDTSNPAGSELLQKASGEKPHGGGAVIDPAGPEYKLILDWITAGAPYSSAASGSTNASGS